MICYQYLYIFQILFRFCISYYNQKRRFRNNILNQYELFMKYCGFQVIGCFIKVIRGNLLWLSLPIIIWMLNFTVIQTYQQWRVSQFNDIPYDWTTLIITTAFGKNQQHIYYSAKDLSNNFVIRKYNITQYTFNSTVLPLVIYNQSQQTYNYNKLIQINQTFLVGYSSINPVYQIFYINGTSFSYRSALPKQVNQIFFSYAREQVYLLYLSGSFDIQSLNQFLNSPANFTSFNISIGTGGKISPNQNYMAFSIGTQIKFFDLINRQYSVNATFTAIKSIVWKSNSQSMFVLQNSNPYLLSQQSVTNLSNRNSYTVTFPAFNTSGFIQIYHLNQNNNILFMVQRNPSIQLVILIYDFKILTQIYTQNLTNRINSYISTTLTYQPKTVRFNLKTISPNINTYVGFIKLKNQTVYENMSISQVYQQILDYSIRSEMLKFMNKIPGNRQNMRIIFSFFANFDDLWLYSYHQRDYNKAVEYLFNNIKQLENEKWLLLNYKTLWQQFLGLNTQSLQNYLNSTIKLQHTSTKFLQKQYQANGYLLNSLNYYGMNVILTVGIFFICKLVYNILYHYKLKIKKWLQQFRFKIFFLIMILQGNIQFMMYLFGFQLTTLSSPCFLQKSYLIFVLMVNFIFILSIICLYLLIPYFLKKRKQNNNNKNNKKNKKIINLNKDKNPRIINKINKQPLILYENCTNIQNGFIYLTLQYSIRNLILGFVHIVLIQNYFYQIKIMVLIMIEIGFLVNNLIFLRINKNNGFKIKLNVWFNVLTTMLRILLVGTFFIKFDYKSDLEQEELDINISIIIIISYLFVWMLSILINLAYKTKQILGMLKPSFSSIKNKKIKLLPNTPTRLKSKPPNKKVGLIEDEIKQVKRQINLKMQTRRHLGLMNKHIIKQQKQIKSLMIPAKDRLIQQRFQLLEPDLFVFELKIAKQEKSNKKGGMKRYRKIEQI